MNRKQEHSNARFCGWVSLLLSWLALSAAQAQTINYALGTSALLVGPATGTNTVVLAVTPATGGWTATTNANWLHLNPANQNGTGSTNVAFSYEANPGATRSGTLTIGGQTLTVTQAGSTYVAAGVLTTLVSTGLSYPYGVAADAAGNVYIADTAHGALKKWTATNNTVATLLSGLSGAEGLAVDAAGNVYIAEAGAVVITEWTPANNSLTTLFSADFHQPRSVAVDGGGNVYIADSGIDEWTPPDIEVTTLASGSFTAAGVAVDRAGNLYIADFSYYTSPILTWTAANSNLTSLVTSSVSSGLSNPACVAVDSSGNVYFADQQGETEKATNNNVKKWSAANGNVTTLVSSGLLNPCGVALDGAGNVYIADTWNNAIKELPYAFVDTADRLEGLAAGNDACPVVLPATANLRDQFAPTSDQTWLTVTGVTNGVVSFAFTAAASNRTGNLIVLGQKVPVTQGGPSYCLGTSALLAGPDSGSNSVVLAALPEIATWTATANASWLHLSPASENGTGSTNVVFSYDSNPGATRSGTLTIAGQTLTVTQAGSTYVAAGPLTSVVSPASFYPVDVAVNSVGDVYIADANKNQIEEWTAANNTLTTLASSIPIPVFGLAVDGAGNMYLAGATFNMIDKWTAADGTVAVLVSNGLNYPFSVAVDSTGNVYIADSQNNAIKEWTAANSNVTALVALGLDWPDGVAVDRAGNVYIADERNNAIKKWTEADNTVTTVVSSGLLGPFRVVVDGMGNVYILEQESIVEWVAASNTLAPLVSSGLNEPNGLAVDGAGNVYIADTENHRIVELPHAFVDPTPRLENLPVGNDALPTVLPATANLLGPFAPTSDQSWLTITGVTNGVVSFSFTTNTGPSRTAHLTLLGQNIPITQGVIGSPPTLTGVQMLDSGALQFGFTNVPGASLTVLTTTNLSLPWSNWTVAGTATNTAPGQFQFTSQPTTNDAQRYYGVRSP